LTIEELRRKDHRDTECIRRTGTPEAQFRLFAQLWAIATLFHVLGPSSRLIGALNSPSWPGLLHVVLALVAIGLLLRPSRTLPLLIIAALGPLSAWLEAPFLGNHWLLASLVNLNLFLAVATATQCRGFSRSAMATHFVPLTRWTFVLFYGVAAFAKVNTAFFDPGVSCANSFAREIAVSLGGNESMLTLTSTARFLPVAVSVVEFLVPLLLVSSGTRGVGIWLGLVFHSIIALNRVHLFVDFSSVLIALLALFLSRNAATTALVIARLPIARLTQYLLGGAYGVVLIGHVTGTGITRPLTEGVIWIWYFVDCLVLLVFALASRGRMRRRGYLTQHWGAFRLAGPWWLAAAPALVVLNGVLPYLELRTAYSFNMYSNLLMVDGQSNHLIARVSVPLWRRHSGLVRIISSSDPGLALYATRGYDLPWDSFRSYVATHPNVSVTFERFGEREHVIGGSGPERFDRRSELMRRLLPLRAVDRNRPPRCQDTFLPAL
jgi:hypothetical protein